MSSQTKIIERWPLHAQHRHAPDHDLQLEYYADDPGVTIVDTGTGESLLHVDGERMQELDLWVYAIYDEQLYVSTTDGQPIIDAHTGDQVGEWTEYPIGVVNGWTVVSTGSGYRADPPR